MRKTRSVEKAGKGLQIFAEALFWYRWVFLFGPFGSLCLVRR
jgi:hypothetical protein